MKKIFTCLCAVIFILGIAEYQRLNKPKYEEISASTEYGVFVGLEPENISKAAGYSTIVIDAEIFSKEDIEQLHQSGNSTVYSYLNIGSIESFRDWYPDFEEITLGDYENWPKERWVDVSNPKWINHITDYAKILANKGIDGFFLDNADIWYLYPNDNIYQGLLEIIKNLNTLKLPLIINGGDSFVSKGLETGELNGFLDGINQETVFTSINFEENYFGKQTLEDKLYFQEYLSLCKRAGLQVYLVEYGTDRELAQEIDAYCRKNGFFYYISPSLELDGEKK